MAIAVQDFFEWGSECYFDASGVMRDLDEAFVLEGERWLLEQGGDVANVYFKLLAQLQRAQQAQMEPAVLAHLNYLLGYYVGLFLHPTEGDFIAEHYLAAAIDLETDAAKIATYQETIAIIREEV